MKKRQIALAVLALSPIVSYAACCGFELAEATNAGLQQMTKTLQGDANDGRSFAAIKRELENVNNNLMVLGQVDTTLQSQQRRFEEEMMRGELHSLAEIAKREAIADAELAVDKAYGAFDKNAACKQYDQAIKQIQGGATYQEILAAINKAYRRLWDNIKHPTDRTKVVLDLEATDADDIFPQSGFFTSEEAVAKAVKSSAFLVNPYPQAKLDKKEWEGHPFGEKWKEEDNIMQVRLAPVQAAVSDMMAGYIPTMPLDKRMESVLKLSPYTKEQVTLDDKISKNFYMELLASSRYYNPDYTAQITAARGDALVRETIYAYTDLLYLENEALKVEQQNTALLAVIASQAINARTNDRLSAAGQGVSSHYIDGGN